MFYLGIQDKRDYKKWRFSPRFKTIEECFMTYRDWLAKHPGYKVSFMQERVFVPEPPKQGQQ